MFDEAFFADPYPTYAKLRAAAPIHWVAGFRGGAWIVPRYADVAAGLHDARLSSRRSRTFTAALPAEAQPEFAEFHRIFALLMLFQDRPDHGRLRVLLNKSFTPRVVNDLRPHIREIVDRLLDPIVGAGRMEFIADLAYPLPVEVIAELLGVPARERATFKHWSDDFATFFGAAQATLDQARAARDSVAAFTELFRAMVPERRGRPREDLVSLLLQAEEEGDRLTTDEILAQCFMLLFAGHETTRNLLGNGLLALLQHPDQLARLARDRTLLASAVRECARYDSSVQFVTRVVEEDHTRHGRELVKGQTVVLLLGSANRDPDHFPEPDTFDITRVQGVPLSFGHGPHFCLGQALGTAEAEIAFDTILSRLGDLRLADEHPPWRTNPGLRGLRRLPIAFTRLPTPPGAARSAGAFPRS